MNFLAVTCADLDPIIRLIRDGLLPLIYIGIPIILIVLGIIDLGKAVVASKEDEIKKAQQMLVKRAIYAISIFFVVFLVKTIFGIVAGTQTGQVNENGEVESWTSCW